MKIAQVNAQDVVALVLIIAIFALKLTGFDGTLDTILALIAGYYFGRRNDAQINLAETPAVTVPKINAKP